MSNCHHQTPACVEFSGVAIARGGRAVVQDASFAVEAGIFAVLGNNGAGKSTLIHALLDFIPLRAGEIRLWGANHRQYRQRARLSYLPERFAPPWYLTGREFLALSRRMRRQPCDATAARQWAARLTLDPAALERPVRTYSKGMTQKLGLAAVFLADTELIVLDEPMSGLDPNARRAAMDAIIAARAGGKTLFLTSHALADVEQLMEPPGGRLAIVCDGALRYQGGRDALLARYGVSTLEDAYLRCTALPQPQGPRT